MKKIVISINPIYVDSIIKGTKKYEYRTKITKENISGLIIYETFPIKKIVAEVEVVEVLQMHPNELWNLTNKYAGITKDDFNRYFRNREVAYAYKLGHITVFEKPLDLEHFGLKTAPQSFAYAR